MTRLRYLHGTAKRFGTSGKLLIQRTGRVCYGIEIDPRCVEIRAILYGVGVLIVAVKLPIGRAQ